MMQRFVDAVFEDWSKTSNHLDPPKAVEEVPYRTTEYQFGDIAVDASDSDPNLNTRESVACVSHFPSNKLTH